MHRAPLSHRPTVAEFFAGIGLMRMGLERAGWRVVWANDIDADKRRMHAGHFGDGSAYVLGDVHELRAADVPQVTLATASFPCTDLSLAGARRGLAGAQSSAFWGFMKMLSGMRPPLVLLENVPGFLTSNDGDDLRDACLALNELGYALDMFLIDAAPFVPQSRQRLFIAGSRSSGTESLPQVSAARPRALVDFILWHPEIRLALRELPALPPARRDFPSILEPLSPNSSLWWSRERADYLLSQMSPRHRATADAMIAADQISHGTIFRRVRAGGSMAELRTDGLAGCLRTPRGGSGRQILFSAGSGRHAVRLLSPRECARLMGAGDFRLDPAISSNRALFGFGDAVCVPVIEWIAKNCLTPLLAEAACRIAR